MDEDEEEFYEDDDDFNDLKADFNILQDNEEF